MADATMPQVVRSYLAKLEKALSGVSTEVREEIVAGVAEELSGLESAAAAARIEVLGDPEFIAAEARAGATTPAELASQAEATTREPGWYPVLSALLVAFGGFMIPVIGWVVGLAMACFSKTWTRLEKLIAVVTPILAVAAIVLVSVVSSWSQHKDNDVPSSGFHAPQASDFANPLMPAPYDLLWSGAILFGGVNVVVGIWLLWRAKRAWAVPVSPRVTTATAVSHASWYPVVTVLLIILGGYLVPLVGWVAGVAMLWGADAWSTKQKLWGSVAGPLAVLAVLTAGAVANLSPGGLGGWHAALLGVLVAPLIANSIVGADLIRNRRGQPGAQGESGAAAPSA